jgi:hypothetical protein
VKWVETKFRRPRTGDALLKVRWRNGEESRHEYTARQLVWEDRGWPFDIIEVAKA